MRRQIFFTIVLASYLLAGCATTRKDPDSLAEAKKVYYGIAVEQHMPAENLLRCDWLPWYSEAPEGAYCYSIPYLPYFVVNSTVIYLVEGLTVPAWIFTGGSKYQDQAEDWLEDHTLRYEKIFNATWPGARRRANLINMDDQPVQQSGIKSPSEK